MQFWADAHMRKYKAIAIAMRNEKEVGKTEDK